MAWDDGTVTWTTTERFGGYWSMVSDGNRILALDERGELLLIRPTPERFDLVERRTVSREDTWAHLAVLDGYLAIRDLKGVAVWTWR